MNPVLAPSNPDELAEAVLRHPRVIPVGGTTKPRLTVSSAAPDAVPISTRRLNGLVEYDPSEFTFTALAGSPVREVARALAERGQYLPFDPMLSDAGATLGGTIASGLSGPGRFRFGGIRDFLIGVRFVDGAGRLLRLGGKVVKNAAGFDVPKFLVGSLGRWGVLAEVTFKVFPKPEAWRTVALHATDLRDAARILHEISVNRWELDALDVPPTGDRLLVRFGGPGESLAPRAREILERWPGEVLSEPEADRAWSDLAEFRWAHPGGRLLKVPLTPDRMSVLREAFHRIGDVRVHFSAGGHVAYVSTAPDADPAPIAVALESSGDIGLALRGAGPLWWGARPKTEIESAVRTALDPMNRFVPMEG
ncbi:MAG: FAD-binding protein [Limisphaerales bacterium]